MVDLAIGLAAARRFILGRQGLWPGRRSQGPAGTEQALRFTEFAFVRGLWRFMQFLKAHSIDFSAIKTSRAEVRLARQLKMHLT